MHPSLHRRVPLTSTLTLLALLTLPHLALAQSRPPARRPTASLETTTRSIDGSGNHRTDTQRGAAGTAFRRLAPADYADGIDAIADVDRPNPRAISNAVCAQSTSIPNPRGASDFLWQWGQFLDHDLDLTGTADPVESASIPIPTGDLFFDPSGTGSATLSFRRSLYDVASGTDETNPREQINLITAWIDASQVYGSDDATAASLRTFSGGRLATSDDDLLPVDEAGFFIAGDVRVNEQLGLIAMQTLFLREHNRIVASLARSQPNLTDEQLYQRARRIVGALMQSITYREFLPLLLGPDALPPYAGYQPGADGRIANEFAAAAFRLGHSMLNQSLRRVGADGSSIAAGDIALRDAFFAPDKIRTDGGIDPVLRGLAAQAAQNIDPFVVDDVRNFLFGAPGAGGFDLASLNLQRGRDHGLPSYNDMRRALGLRPAQGFADISNNPEIQNRLASIYPTVEDIDLWIGGLSEDHRRGALVGPLFATILARQFAALRDGDRYWYQRTLSPLEQLLVESTRLSDVIRRNTGIGRELASDVFRVARR